MIVQKIYKKVINFSMQNSDPGSRHDLKKIILQHRYTYIISLVTHIPSIVVRFIYIICLMPEDLD